MHIEVRTKVDWLGLGKITCVQNGGPGQAFVLTVIVGNPGTPNIISVGDGNPHACELRQLAELAQACQFDVWWEWLTPGGGDEMRALMVLGQ